MAMGEIFLGESMKLRSGIIVVLMAVLVVACGKGDEPTKSSDTTAGSVGAPATPKYDIPADAGEMTSDAAKGDWNVGPAVAKVVVEGDQITCFNEKGTSSKCQIEDGKVLVATDWRVYAFLLAGGKVLRWSDGSGWTR
jgi:hypothetical protein